MSARLLAENSAAMYSSRSERAALRSALGDATALCDLLSTSIERENCSRNGSNAVTKKGRELAAVAKRCADSIWAMRELITVPEDDPLTRDHTEAHWPSPSDRSTS